MEHLQQKYAQEHQNLKVDVILLKVYFRLKKSCIKF